MEALLEVPVLGVLIGTILPFLLVLSVVVFVHEFGHYIVGRWSGIHAEVFSIGFGPEIFGFTDRRGTRWKLSAVPLGGYVKFLGDANAASGADNEAVSAMSPEERRHTMPGAPLWARSATVAAGPIANFILSALLFVIVGLAQGKPSEAPVIGSITPTGQAAGAGLAAGDKLLAIDGAPVATYGGFLDEMLKQENTPRNVTIERDGETLTLPVSFGRSAMIERVNPGTPAEAACLKPGDVIQAVDGETIASFNDLVAAVQGSAGAALSLTIERDGALIEKEVTPKLIEQPDLASGSVERRLLIGVQANFNLGVAPEREAMGVVEAIQYGVASPVRIIGLTLGYLGSLVAGDADGSSLGGPIGIASGSAQAASEGLIGIIVYIALISTAIGLINLFPIPILDGGHLVFYAIEAIKGEPLGERYTDIAMMAGFAAIIGLLIFATTNDVSRLANAWTAAC